MATFVQRETRGRRVWQALIRRRGYPQQTRTFPTKAEAEAWAAIMESEIARGVFVSRTEAESTTLRDALLRYQREITVHKKGAVQETSRIKGWMTDPLASRSLAGIRGKDIAQHIEERSEDGAAASTIHKELALLSHLFNVAQSKWGMESLRNPVSLTKGHHPKLPHGRERRLQGDEEKRLLAAAHGEIRAIIIWATETAMRRGEISAMRWEHLDKKARTLLIPETKNGEPRKIPLSSRALAAIKGLTRRIDGRVWGLESDSISQAFERARDRAGIDNLHFHDLRHEAVSRFFEMGFNPMDVASISGHKTLQMLKRYTHLKAEDLAKRLG